MKSYCGSVPGPLLEKLGKNNQDAYLSMNMNTEQYGSILIVAVADGAGSLKHSREGAEFCVKFFVKTMIQKIIDFGGVDDPYESRDSGIVGLLPELVAGSFLVVRDKLMEIEDYLEYGCTLAVGVYVDDCWCVGVVGDASAVVLFPFSSITSVEGKVLKIGESYGDSVPTILENVGGEVVSSDGSVRLSTVGEDVGLLVSNDGAGEFANITELLTSRDPDLKIFCGEGFIVGGLGSDGVDTFTLNNGYPHVAFWNSMLKQIGNNPDFTVDGFLQYLRDNDRLVDDTTLAIIL